MSVEARPFNLYDHVSFATISRPSRAGAAVPSTSVAKPDFVSPPPRNVEEARAWNRASSRMQGFHDYVSAQASRHCLSALTIFVASIEETLKRVSTSKLDEDKVTDLIFPRKKCGNVRRPSCVRALLIRELTSAARSQCPARLKRVSSGEG